MPKDLHYRYRVEIYVGEHATHGDMPGFLDMLRYEGSRVTRWDRVDRKDGISGESYNVQLENTRPPVVERWRSFGVYPTDADGNVLQPSLAGSDAIVW